MKKIVIAIVLWIISFSSVYANPTFYFDESSYTLIGYTHSVQLFIDTDGVPITAAQTIIDLPETYFTFQETQFSDYPWPEYDSGTKPNCTHSLLPPDWSLPYKSSPYVDDEGDKLYIACGFTGGYTTQGSSGDEIAAITFTAEEIGTTTFSFETVNTKFYHNGTYIAPGAMSSYSVAIQSYIEPTPGPGVVPDGAEDSITESDLNFVEIGLTGTQTSSSGNSGDAQELEAVELDDTIPPPPDNLPERSIPNPISTIINRTTNNPEIAEVLSAQSLRELLVPGKSTADKTLVLINLISVLLFLLILAILVWRYISIKRMDKIRAKHMSELLIGELATIESKIEGTSDSSKESVKSDIDETIRKIKEEAK